MVSSSAFSLQKIAGTDGGVTLRRVGGNNNETKGTARIVITAVASHVATATGLKVGQNVVSMNNIDCTLLSEASAQDILMQNELVTFLVSPLPHASGLVVADIPKSEASASGMITYLEEDKDQHVVVGADKEGKDNCLTSVCPSLEPGMRILSVNNIDCVDMSSTEVASLFTDKLSQHFDLNASGKVSVLAQSKEGVASIPKKERNSYKYTTVSVEGQAPLGVELVTSFHPVDWSRQVLIKSISKESIFFGTGLRVGMELVSINGIDCSMKCGASSTDVMNLLQDSQGSPMTILAQQARHKMPGSLFTVILHKASVDDKLGVGLGLDNNKTMVRTLKNGSIASLTTLELDMHVQSINNIPCGEDNLVAQTIIKEAVGPLVFLVQTPGPKTYEAEVQQMVTASMTKTSKTDKIGCTLTTQGDDVVISKIFHKTLADYTALKVGMKIHKINNMDCTKLGLAEAQRLMSGANGNLTILAEKAKLEPGSYVAAAITCADALGMRIAQTDNKDMPYIISKIIDGGLVAQTDLQEGMLLKSINNVDCTEKATLAEFREMLATKERPLNILAVTPGDAAVKHTSLITTLVPIVGSIEKGALAFDKDTGAITITEIGAKGFLYGTSLRFGMTILSLNNVPAKQFTRVSLRNYLDAQDFLLVVARKRGLKMGVIATEVLHRPSVSMPLGIGIKQFRDKIYVSTIRDATIAATSKLQPGMEILSIDNEECRGMEKQEFARISREAVGDILIVVSTQKKSFLDDSTDPSIVTACFDMTGENAKVGLSLVMNSKGKLAISKITSNTLAAESELMVGMELVAIDNEIVDGMSVKDALSKFAAAQGNLPILAKRPLLAPGSLVTASIVKETPTTSAGLRMGLDEKGRVCIKHIVAFGPASFTDLSEGMLVEAINDVSTANKKLKEVNALFAESHSVVTILARATADISVGRASFRSSRSLCSRASILSQGQNRRASIDSAVSNTSSLSDHRDAAFDFPAPLVAAPVIQNPFDAAVDPATMDRVAPAAAKTTTVSAARQTKRVLEKVAAESREDDDDGQWC